MIVKKTKESIIRELRTEERTVKNKFDQVWIQNRLRYRKNLKGTAMRVDEATGYLEPITIRGFTANTKELFITRFKVCSNMAAICRSLRVDNQSVYDAIVLDPKFRAEFIKCYETIGRKPQLNDQMVILADSAKTRVISDLSSKMDKYGPKSDPFSPEHYK